MIGQADDVLGRRPRVVIIGGGLAGLAAADALGRSGADLAVTVLEARRCTGGRAGSFLDPLTGQSVDYCQHVAMGCCTNLLSMLSDCGLADSLQRHTRLLFHHPATGAATFAATAWLPAPLHLLPAVGALRYLSADQCCQIRRGTWRLMRCRPQDVASVPSIQWLRDNGQAAATVRDYWNVVITSALGESCEAVSMAAVRKVFIDGFLAARGASDVLIPREPLSQLFGAGVPSAIRSLGVRIVPETLVGALRLAPASRHGERLLVELRETQLLADHAILAVPWHQLAKIIDPSLAARAKLSPDLWSSFPASPISGVHLWYDKPITDVPHAVLVGTLAQWMFQPAAQSRRTGESYYQVVISAARSLRQMSQQQVVGQIAAELAVAFPDAGSAKLLRSRVVTDPQSVFSIRPEVDAARPGSSTALPCLHLAGDFVQTGWPATMEGAVISGRQAANSLLNTLGRPPVSISSGLPSNWLGRRLISALG